MILDDYLMRLIHRFSQGMARVASHRKAGEPVEALRELEDVANDVFGLGPRNLGDILASELRSALRVGKQREPKKMIMMAELLEVRGEILEELEREEQQVVEGWALALRLYAQALTENRELRTGENKQAIERLHEKMTSFQLSFATLKALMDYYERVGSFSQAEDVFYELLEVDEPRALERGRAFYAGLLTLPDEDLQEGGLPRNEVQEGLEMVEEREKVN